MTARTIRPLRPLRLVRRARHSEYGCNAANSGARPSAIAARVGRLRSAVSSAGPISSGPAAAGEEMAEMTARCVLEPPSVSAGIRLGGRYRLEDRIEDASGASVWRAIDEVLNRPVTVRALTPGRPVPVEVITAVLGAARLNDPRLARIFDADCETESPYIVSEWLLGERLDDLISAGSPGPWQAAAIAWAAADALAVAHRAGQSHLCLTPRSLCWDVTGVKITGLALEAAIAGKTASDPAAADARGSAEVLYSLLTGHWPGNSPTELPPAPRLHGQPCRPRMVRAGVPDVLDSIICRILWPWTQSDRGLGTPAQVAQELLTAISNRPRSRHLRWQDPRPLLWRPIPGAGCSARPA
jgi:hypothetical protein